MLLLVQSGFLPPSDPRIIGTVAAIGQDLMADGLIRHTARTRPMTACLGRRRFLACSFWYASIARGCQGC